MEKSKEEVSVCRISKSTATLNENVVVETLEESVDCSSRGQIEGSFSEELVGEDAGGCIGKDIMVEVLGSDVYIDGVCTRGSEAELNDEVACGGSVEVDKDVKPSGGAFRVGNEAEAGFGGLQVMQSSEARSENAIANLDGAIVEREEVLMGALKDRNVNRGETAVHTVENDVENTQGAPVLDNGAEKDEVGTGVSDSLSALKSKPEETEVPTVEGVRHERMNAQEAGVPDDMLTNTTFDNALGGLTAVSSLGGEDVHSESVEKDNQQQRSLSGHGATEGRIDMTLKLLDEKKKIVNMEADKILDKEACSYHKVESMETNVTDEKLHSVGEQPIEIDKVGENSNSLLKEIVAGTGVAVDKNHLNSEEEKCIEKKGITVTSQVSSDTGQGMELNKNFHEEGFSLLGGEQNSENYETVGASTNRDAQVCIGEISLINREGTINFNDDVPGCAGDLALVDSVSRKQMNLNEKVSNAEHASLLKGKEAEVEDQSERTKMVSHTANIQGKVTGGAITAYNPSQLVAETETAAVSENILSCPDNKACNSVDAGKSVSFCVSENNLDANTISKNVEDNKIADGRIAEEENCNDELPFSADDQKLKFLNRVKQSVTSDVDQVESNVRKPIEEQLDGISEQVSSHGGQEMEVEEFNNADQQKTIDDKIIKHITAKTGSSGKFYQANYLLPPEKEGELSVSDMVWGKVRSHPWWPGQIFDPSDSSEKALKHYKKDCFLVAYFGDRTFAWNEASQLKPFREHFSSIEKHSNSESFQNAVDCALDEVSRRVEFGLACSCIPEDTYDTLKFQTVENTGIRAEISFRYGVDESLNASSFSPDELIDYVKSLSQCPTGGFNRLELVIAKAQLLAFYRLKGYFCLPELQYCGGLDNDLESSIDDAKNNLSEVIQHATPVSKNADQASAGHGALKSQNSSYHKRKHNLKDGMYPKKKEKSLSELIGGTPDSPDGDYWSDEKAIDSLASPTLSKKRRTVDPYADDSGMQDGRKTISLAKVSNSSKQSFKIGECIRRVASQLTGSPSTLKSSGERSQKPDGSTDVFAEDVSDVSFQNLEEAQRSSLTVPTEYSSLDDLLSLFQWVAQDPLENCNFLSVIVSFFSDFRNSIIVGNYSGSEISPTNKVGTKRKKLPTAGSPETFEFDDMSDTYWTDRVIHNGSEEQPSKRNRKKDNQPVSAEPGKPAQASRRANSRKRYSDNNHAEASEKPSGYIDERSPAELVMNFAELDTVPSEANLNKMFRRFGPLKESETEVDRVSSRARVVFKKCADAEVAFNSAKKFNIFGQVLVNYQLNYTPSALFKASIVATTQDQEMHLDLSNFEVNMV